MNQNFYKKMMEQAEPSALLLQKTRRRMKAKVLGEIRPVRRSFRAAVVFAVMMVMFTTTAFAAWHFLKPSDVAKKFNDNTLSVAFDSETAININKSVRSGEYIFTLLAVVSGKDITDTPYDSEGIQDERMYALAAFQNADGSPWPGPQEEAYGQPAFLATPLVKGLKPWNVNAVTMNGGYEETVVDGVLYRIVECDSVAMFADRGLYFAVCSTPFIDNSTFRYDEKTGEISVNPEFDGASALFELPMDPSMADAQKAKAYLADFLDENGDLKSTGDDTAQESAEADEFMANWEAIDWDSIEPVKSTMREMKPDAKGNLSYTYDFEGGGGTIEFAFNEYFTKDTMPQSAIVSGSSSEGPEGKTYLAVRVDKDADGRLTGMVLVTEPIK